MDAYTFQDIFDIEAIEKLIETLSTTLQVGISIRGAQGERYSKDNDYCRLCQYIKNSPVGKARCEESDLALCTHQEQSPYICHCQSAGLTDARINIMIGEMHVASVLVGQIRLEEDTLSEEEYRKIARSLQIDEEEYLRYLDQIPVKTREQFESILNMLSLMAEQISTLGQKNLYLKSIINSLENQEMVHQKEKELLEKLAETDSMTGLYNHRKFEEIFSKYSTMQERRICMVSADANFLKLMNDVFGHDAGDLMLKNMSKILYNLAKKDWLVARCGGDEFRIILPDTELATAQDYCKHVARYCGEDRSLAFPLSLAMGAAEWDSEAETLQDCFARADSEMSKNKAIIKQTLHIPDLIMERLYSRQLLNRDMV